MISDKQLFDDFEKAAVAISDVLNAFRCYCDNFDCRETFNHTLLYDAAAKVLMTRIDFQTKKWYLENHKEDDEFSKKEILELFRKIQSNLERFWYKMNFPGAFNDCVIDNSSKRVYKSIDEARKYIDK